MHAHPRRKFSVNPLLYGLQIHSTAILEQFIFRAMKHRMMEKSSPDIHIMFPPLILQCRFPKYLDSGLHLISKSGKLSLQINKIWPLPQQ